ncbi:MAG: protein-tyrosine-phosphatase [Proteobacteria bacterium]|nr:protein-tyrosine-phosphatase [Pseudomonadota bacterium]
MSTDQPPFGITICGIEELEGHCATGASHVLSILDPDYPVPEAFGQYGEHERLELRFDDIIDPVPGLIAPSAEQVASILAFGSRLEPGANLIVHCHAGISRSTASMTLILAQAMPEQPAEAILGTVLDIREKAWPNLRIIEMGDRMLGWDGRLVDAACGLYRLQIERRPHIAAMMEDGGRGRELALARRHAPLKV